MNSIVEIKSGEMEVRATRQAAAAALMTVPAPSTR